MPFLEDQVGTQVGGQARTDRNRYFAELKIRRYASAQGRQQAVALAVVPDRADGQSRPRCQPDGEFVGDGPFLHAQPVQVLEFRPRIVFVPPEHLRKIGQEPQLRRRTVRTGKHQGYPASLRREQAAGFDGASSPLPPTEINFCL